MGMPGMTVATVFAAAALFFASHSFAAGREKPVQAPSPTALELRLALRDLWIEDIFWIRNAILETKYADTAGAKLAEERAVQSGKRIAEAMTPYYGKEASDKLYALLSAHYGAIKTYRDASFAGKKDDRAAPMEALKKNAAEIAELLASANPNWKKETLASAFAVHAGHHVSQMDALAAGDFSQEAQTWTAMKMQVYGIADTMADGILRQYPMKFRK